jgi:putative endonuclease
MVNFFEEYYWVYVLLSLKDGKKYTGYTKNLPLRFEQHQKGLVDSTKYRRPLIVIYIEGSLNQQDAIKREKYLKTHYGKMYLGNRLKEWISEQK